jgi:hypothetical protein
MVRMSAGYLSLADVAPEMLALDLNHTPIRNVLISMEVERARRRFLARNEAAVRELLGRWVSELEPATVLNRHGYVIGLTMADAMPGSMPFILWLDP